MPQVPVERRVLLTARSLVNLLFGVALIAFWYNSMLFPQIANYSTGILVLGSALLVLGILDVCSTYWLRRPTRKERKNLSGYDVRITREGLAFLAIMITSFMAAFVGSSNSLMLIFSMLGGAFVINGSVTLQILRKNRIERRLPRNVMAGEPLAVELVFTNQRKRFSSWLMLVRDRIANSREVLLPQVLYSRIAPGNSLSAWYQVRFSQRGVYEFGPIRVMTRFPLGFVERSLQVEQPGRILVHPRIGRLTSEWRQRSADAEDLLRRSRSRIGTHEDDFHRLREFRTGDNPRAIHWMTSARSNELMVREFHETRDRDLMVILELAGDPTSVEPNLMIELAISFAATLCVDHCRRNRGSRLFLGIAGKKPTHWSGSGGPNVIPFLLDDLAIVEPVADPDIHGILQAAAQLDWRGSRRIWVTSRKPSMAGDAPLSGGRRTTPQAVRNWRIVQADPEELAPLFEWNW